MKIKPLEEVVACVVDYGTFISVAEKLGQHCKKVYYHSPCETEYKSIENYVLGEGVPGVERCNDIYSVFPEVDLFVFPDIGFAGLQRHLSDSGKAVWGSREATDLELYRTTFLDQLKRLGLPVPKYRVVVGVHSLAEMLKKTEDVWIKCDCYRANMETWKHIDYAHSEPMLVYLAECFGGAADAIKFIVQETIPDAQENGYDGYCVDGQFPQKSFQGYELKNELYLGSWLPANDLPEEVKAVNEKFAPVLASIGYRNFFATELRNEFFIDPTIRMAGQTQEHLLETCSNIADVIWQGANGKLVEPHFTAQFAASATLHYKEIPQCENSWKVLRVPKDSARWFKLYGYCQDGETYHFPPGRNDEVGVVIGNGDTIEKAITNLKRHLDTIEEEPVCAEVEQFARLLDEIKAAEAEGIKFSNQPVPKADIVL